MRFFVSHKAWHVPSRFSRGFVSVCTRHSTAASYAKHCVHASYIYPFVVNTSLHRNITSNNWRTFANANSQCEVSIRSISHDIRLNKRYEMRLIEHEHDAQSVPFRISNRQKEGTVTVTLQLRRQGAEDSLPCLATPGGFDAALCRRLSCPFGRSVTPI